MTSPWVQAGGNLPLVQHADNELAITEYNGGIALAFYDANENRITYSFLYE